MNFQPTFLTADGSHVDLLLQLMKEFYLVEGLPFDENIARRGLEQIFSKKTFGSIYIIAADQEIVGYIVLTFGFSLEFHGRDALVDEFYVRESFRRKGIGSRALEFIQEICRNEGINALHLEVDRNNQRAQSLYRKHGFRDHDRFLLTRWLNSTSRTEFPER